MNYYIQGDAANADQIKAAFKEKGFDADWCPIASRLLYFTVNGRVHVTDLDSIYADIIKTHPDYKELELPKPHYDISNFKPFDKVLARDFNNEKWQCAWFSSYNKELPYSFITTGADYCQCIPFGGNERLLGTTDMCDEMYINW